jgi:hypothetical protein
LRRQPPYAWGAPDDDDRRMRPQSADCALAVRGIDILRQRSQNMRRAAYARGAREAKLAAVALGACASHDQAAAWINGAIDERTRELRRGGTSDEDIEAWDWARRIMFMLKIRHAIVKPPDGGQSAEPIRSAFRIKRPCLIAPARSRRRLFFAETPGAAADNPSAWGSSTTAQKLMTRLPYFSF